MPSYLGAQVNICHANSQDTDRILQLTMHNSVCFVKNNDKIWGLVLKAILKLCCNLNGHSQSVCSQSDSSYSNQNRGANRNHFCASFCTNQSLLSKGPESCCRYYPNTLRGTEELTAEIQIACLIKQPSVHDKHAAAKSDVQCRVMCMVRGLGSWETIKEWWQSRGEVSPNIFTIIIITFLQPGGEFQNL